MCSSPIRTIYFRYSLIGGSAEQGRLSPQVVNCLIRLAVRTPRCGRGNPGSNPGLDIFSRLSASIFVRDNRSDVSERRPSARLAQLVERQPFKLVVVGSSPTVGAFLTSGFKSGKFPPILFINTTEPSWRNG